MESLVHAPLNGRRRARLRGSWNRALDATRPECRAQLREEGVDAAVDVKGRRVVQRSGDLLSRTLVVEAEAKEHLVGGRERGERCLERVVKLERSQLLVRAVRLPGSGVDRLVELLDARVAGEGAQASPAFVRLARQVRSV